MIDQENLQYLISDVSRPPDHSVLSVVIETSAAVRERVWGNTLGSKSVGRKGKLIRRVGEQYMRSDTAQKMLPVMLNNFDKYVKCQKEMDDCYGALVNFLLEESETIPTTKVN